MILGARTKKAYEYFNEQDWITNIEKDEIWIDEPINDESQTIYGQEKEEEIKQKYRTYGIGAMGLNNYKKIVNENGNPADIVIATIGYGARINDRYFEGRISGNYYNFIENNKNIYETLPQGSRILEVIKESTTDNVKILPLVIVNQEYYTSKSSIIEALSFATKNSDVICYEILNEENYMINLVLKNAFKENVPVSCPTRKAENKEEKIYPAENSTTIAVSSIDKSSKPASYSGSGDYIDFVAYSTDIEEIFEENSSVSMWSGIQYSNAHLVSCIAMIKTYEKEYTILDIYNMLRNYCVDLGHKGKDNLYGYGVPNFSKIKITDIDKKSPEIKDVIYDNEKWEFKKNIHIKAEDNIKIVQWAVTDSQEVPEKWTTLEGNKSTLDVDYEITKNGIYYIWVSDSAENTSYRTIKMDKIDTTAPEIRYAIETDKLETEKYVVIKITANDTESGLNEMPYSFDKENWGMVNELKVTENGRYKVYARDALENVSEKEIKVTEFPMEGYATIEPGNIIKSITVSDNWTGNTNNDVRILLNSDVEIIGWNITKSKKEPTQFTEPEGVEIIENTEEPEEPDDIEQPDENDTNTANNTTTEDTEVNVNRTEENLNNTDNTNIEDIQPRRQVKGVRGITITTSLNTNTKYYLWIKDTNDELICQTFTINKKEI